MFGCSPINIVHELGLKRCETVWSLSATIKIFLKVLFSTRGLCDFIHLWINYNIIVGLVVTIEKNNYMIKKFIFKNL